MVSDLSFLCSPTTIGEQNNKKGGYLIMDIGVLIGIVVTIVIGVALIPVVTDTINSLDTSTMSSATVSLIKILPIIVVTLLIVGAVGYFVLVGRR
jgi:NAD/NADP transhydrogenase beta subunit